MKGSITLTLLLLVLPLLATAQCLNGDCLNGKGRYRFDNGAQYVGDFVNGKAEGYGVCHYPNGNVYKGYWKGHQFDGEGVYMSAGTPPVLGLWKAGELTKTISNDTLVRLPKVWVILVGVSAYHSLPSLRYSDDDVYQMYAFFKSTAGGSLRDDQIHLLVDEHATFGRIQRAMQEVAEVAHVDDMVLFYFSGHGKPDGLLPFDYDGQRNRLSFDELRKWFERTIAMHKICITDACYSGGITESIKAETSDFFARSAPDNTALLVSSQPTEISLESTGLRQGTFSYFLIKGMKGTADRNRDNVVSIQELYDFVSQQVKSYTQGAQRPGLYGKFDPNLPISTLPASGRP